MKRCAWGVVWGTTLVLMGSPAALAQVDATLLASGFTQPVFAASAPGSPGTLYVVQQGGLIRGVDVATGNVAATPLLNLPGITDAQFRSGGEQGLLGLAFHPDFANNGLMYAKYNFNNGQTGGGSRVEQFTVSGGVANPASRRTVLQWDHDATNTNHNAGWIGFNPVAQGAAANQLYVMTGDGGGSNDPRNNAQNLGVFLGKTLRVDVGVGLSDTNPNYAIPEGNITTAGARPELYAYGLRNPFRASFDRVTGHLYIGDVGQNSREEVNVINNGSPGGANFGWRLREGTIATPGSVGGPPPSDNVEPIFEYLHTQNIGRSITGGYVYRGSATDDSGEALDGTYIFGDFVSGRIFSLRYDGQTASDFRDRTTEFGFNPGQINISSFGEDGFGNLYVIGYNGTVYTLAPVPEPATVLLVSAGALLLGRGGLRAYRTRR